MSIVIGSKSGRTLSSTGYAPPVLNASHRRIPLGPVVRGRHTNIERMFGAIGRSAHYLLVTMARRWSLLALLAFATSPAYAIEPPSNFGSAIGYGKSVGLDKLLLSPEWSAKCNGPDDAYAKIWTPFWEIAVYEAQARSRYEDDAAARTELADKRKLPAIDVTYEVSNEDLDANSNPAIVVLQGARVVHPLIKSSGHPKAAGSLGFTRTLSARFALSSLNAHRPFTVVFAGVDDREQNGMVSEIRCKVDPSKIR